MVLKFESRHPCEACFSSVLGLQPSKRRPFPIKTRVIWVPGIFIHIYSCVFDLALPSEHFEHPIYVQ